MGFPVLEFKGEGVMWVENSSSVLIRKDIVRDKLLSELKLDQNAGPFKYPPFSNFRISQLAVVSKKEPNSFCIIHNLSFPDKCSFNDETDKSNATVHYASFDKAV